MPAYPALPIFIDAWALDCSHLNDAEDGRYFRLCRLLWSQPECRIPNDNDWIARKLGRPVGDVLQLFRPLISEFFQTDGNWITQKRLLKEWRYVRKRSRQNSVAAKLRWQQEKEASERNADTHSERNAPTPTPTPTPTPINTTPADAGVVVSKKGAGNGRQRPRTRISPDRQPDARDAAYAEQCGTACDWQREWSKFVSHHVAKGTVMADWHHAWRTWCDRAVEYAAKGNGGGNRRGNTGVVAGLRLALDQIDEWERDR